jgi:hypothetical protein
MIEDRRLERDERDNLSVLVKAFVEEMSKKFFEAFDF